MRRSLAGPFALIGAAGGWLTADLFGLGGCSTHVDAQDSLVRALLVVVTPLSAAVVGRGMTRDGRTSFARFVFLPIGGGAMNGAVIGLLAAFPLGAIPGAVIGAMMGIAFLPFLAPAFAAARAASARDRSWLAWIERRAAWMGAFVAIALGSLVAPRGAIPQVSALVQAFLALGAVAGAAVIAILDAFDCAGLRRLERVPLGPRTARPAGATLDVGIGEERGEQVVPAQSAYRGAEGVALAVVGSPEDARRRAQARLAISVLAMTLAALAASVRVTRAAVREVGCFPRGYSSGTGGHRLRCTTFTPPKNRYGSFQPGPADAVAEYV